MHTLLDYDCLLLEFVNITDGKRSDNKATFDIEIKPHSIVVADRGYCDYGLLNHWDSNNVFYVGRHKDNIRYRTIEELPLPKQHTQNVLMDESIEFGLPAAKEKFPKRLKRIAVWNIEIFFRNLKQLLRIKSFIGTSRNAVEIQIWTAMITMLLFSWLKHIARYKWALANLAFLALAQHIYQNRPIQVAERALYTPSPG